MFVYIMFENEKYYVKGYDFAQHVIDYTLNKDDAKKITQKALDKIRKKFPHNKYYTETTTH